MRMLINPTFTAAKAAGAPTSNYGVFLQAAFDLIIIAFILCAARWTNDEEKFLMEIRDARKGRD